jgi:hypothetical protein
MRRLIEATGLPTASSDTRFASQGDTLVDLRRKVDLDPERPRIETMIGNGDRFLDHAEGQDGPARGASST